jgi:hypothetical protein
MKKSVLLFIIAVPLFVFSCKKGEDDTIANFRAVKNGKEWVATSYRVYLSKTENVFSINATKRNPVHFEDEVLHFSFLVSDISPANTVSKFSASWSIVIGGDGISNRYKTDTTADNMIQIDTIDATNRIISGTFRVKMKRDDFYTDIPEFIDFTSGQFSLKYEEIYVYNKSK